MLPHPGAVGRRTRELATAPAAEDRCGACGAPLAHDQRYCVECGERRGRSRFPVAQPATEVRARRARTVRPRRPATVSSGTTLVAGVGVLLLAIGLGVLIGRIGNNKSAPTRAAAPQVITVQGGGGGVASTTPTTRTTVHLSKKAKAKLNSAAAASAPPPAAVQKKATEAAGKVPGQLEEPGAADRHDWSRNARATRPAARAASSAETSSGRERARSCGCPN